MLRMISSHYRVTCYQYRQLHTEVHFLPWARYLLLTIDVSSYHNEVCHSCSCQRNILLIYQCKYNSGHSENKLNNPVGLLSSEFFPQHVKQAFKFGPFFNKCKLKIKCMDLMGMDRQSDYLSWTHYILLYKYFTA